MLLLLDLLFLLLVFSFISFLFQGLAGLRNRLGGQAGPQGQRHDSLRQTQEMTRRTAWFQGMDARQEERLNDSLTIMVCVSRFALQVAAADGGITQASLAVILNYFRSASPQFLQHLQAVLIQDINNPTSIDWEYNLSEARRVLAKDAWKDFHAILFDGLVRISLADGYASPREQEVIYTIMGNLGWSREQTESWFRQRVRQGDRAGSRGGAGNGWAGAEDFFGQGGQRQQGSAGRSNGMSRTQAAQILGVKETDSPETIKARYRSLVREHHPDRYAQMGEEMQKSATARFQTIQQAWEVLKD